MLDVAAMAKLEVLAAELGHATNRMLTADDEARRYISHEIGQIGREILRYTAKIEASSRTQKPKVRHNR